MVGVETAYRVDSGGCQEIPRAAAATPYARFRGGELSDLAIETAPTAAEIITRVAPFTSAYLGADLWVSMSPDEVTDLRLEHPQARLKQTHDGKVWQSCSGVCFQKNNVIHLDIKMAQRHVLEAAFHESFHAVSWHLPSEIQRILNTSVNQGFPYKRDYMKDREERKARMFAAYAMAREEGWGLDELYRPTHGGVTPTDVLEDIYSGVAGREINKDLNTPPPPPKKGILESLRSIF